jgi:hypothetical protein
MTSLSPKAKNGIGKIRMALKPSKGIDDKSLCHQ